MILSHLSRLGPVAPKTAPHSGQWIDLIQLSSVSILCLGEQLALLIKACQRGSECGVSKKRTSESTSDRSQQASTMTMMTWEVLLHFGQHFDFQWHLSYTHEHITLLPWPEHISDLKIFQIIQECTPTSFQKWGAYTYEMCHYCSKTGASAWPEFIN